MSKKFILKELSRYRVGTYADIIYRNALLYSNEEAFIYGKEKITFSEFNTRVNSLIHALNAMEVKKGDVLGILSWNCLDYADVYGAAMKGGFISSPYNPRLQANELDYLINYSEAKTLFVGPELVDMVNSLQPRIPKVKNFISFEVAAQGMTYHRDLLANYSKEEPDIQVEEDDPVFLFYTSGTTGVPRGALYTQRRAMEDTRGFPTALSLEQGDKNLELMPLFHVACKNFWGFFFAGGSNILMPQRSFDPEATLQTLQDEKATDIHLVPTHLAAILALPNVDKYDLSSLKRIFYSASPMPFEILKKGMSKWGPRFIQIYGSTEDGPNVTLLSRRQHNILDRPPEELEVLTSAGFPVIGVHVRIVDVKGNDVEPGEVGEIVVQSKSLMQEWWHKPDETRETVVNGWLHTGDMARYDEKGYIYIADRKRDMVVSGGENIFPREVEEILYKHPTVQEAAVIGIPDPYWVERVHAVVVLKKGASVTDQELIDFCKQNLARFKAPKSIEFVDALPKTSTNKILKRELREKYWVGMTRRV
jgi:acyl-CoA synthetase (AMP-forming)/AMP-acid ligase II